MLLERWKLRGVKTAAAWLLMLGCMTAGAAGPPPSPKVDAGDPLDTAGLSDQVRQRVEHTIFERSKVDPSDEKATRIVQVKLGANRWGLRVWGGGGLCGVTGNCGIWVFDKDSGMPLLWDVEGAKFVFRKTQHKGLYDFDIEEKTGCCNGVQHHYQFDGTAYREVP